MRTLHIIPKQGLCNRLRSVASCVQVAKRLDMQAVVHWNKVGNFYARFEDLFEPIPVADVRVEESCGLLNAIPKRRNLKLPKLLQLLRYDQVIYVHRQDMGTDLLSRIRDVPEVLLVSGYSVGPHYPMTELFHPTVALQAKIDACVAAYGPHTIGLHIRGTDNTASKAHSSLEKFIARIDAEVAADASVTFFLATDEAGVQQALSARYGGRIIWRENVLNRTSVEGIQDAVVDLFCLCRTARVIGSYASSYSVVAAEIGGIPLELCV